MIVTMVSKKMEILGDERRRRRRLYSTATF